MSRLARRRLLVGWGAAALAAAALSVVVALRSHHLRPSGVELAIDLVVGLSFAATGLIAWARRPALAGLAAGAAYLVEYEAAAIILLVWLWLTNVALLFGAEVNAEIERVDEVSDHVTDLQLLNRPRGDAS